MHKPEFKAKVALEAIKGELTMPEMVMKYDVQAGQITQWKKQLQSNACEAFDSVDQEKDKEDAEQTIRDLHAKIGQLSVENDFLERGLEKTLGPRGKKW